MRSGGGRACTTRARGMIYSSMRNGSSSFPWGAFGCSVAWAELGFCDSLPPKALLSQPAGGYGIRYCILGSIKLKRGAQYTHEATCS